MKSTYTIFKFFGLFFVLHCSAGVQPGKKLSFAHVRDAMSAFEAVELNQNDLYCLVSFIQHVQNPNSLKDTGLDISTVQWYARHTKEKVNDYIIPKANELEKNLENTSFYNVAKRYNFLQQAKDLDEIGTITHPAGKDIKKTVSLAANYFGRSCVFVATASTLLVYGICKLYKKFFKKNKNVVNEKNIL